jgi:hypothetical protein
LEPGGGEAINAIGINGIPYPYILNALHQSSCNKPFLSALYTYNNMFIVAISRDLRPHHEIKRHYVRCNQYAQSNAHFLPVSQAGKFSGV